MIVYLESSAAVKLIHEEGESRGLRRYLDSLEDGDAVVGSALVETEVRRAGLRFGVDQTDVSDVLAGVSLLAMPREIYSTAGLLPGRSLRSLDALHVASALRAAAGVLVTYDRRIKAAAGVVGLTTASPS